MVIKAISFIMIIKFKTIKFNFIMVIKIKLVNFIMIIKIKINNFNFIMAIMIKIINFILTNVKITYF
jgi:hypothetical protein